MKEQKNEHIFWGGYSYQHPFTIWEQIREEIIALIICGELRQGDKALSLTEVSALYNCGRATAQKALGSLHESGILHMVPGKGFFVSKTEGLKEQLAMEYKQNMADTLQKYIAMGKCTGMTDEEILKEVEKCLNGE